MSRVSVPYNYNCNGESTQQRTVQLSLTDHQLGLIDRLAEAAQGREEEGEGDEMVDGGKGVQRGHRQFMAGRENNKIDRELSEAAVRTRAGQMARFRVPCHPSS